MRQGRVDGWVLGLACAAQFMVVLDVSVVNVALPAVRDALGFGTGSGSGGGDGGLAWVASGYALAFAGLLLPGGRLADLYGLRRVLAAGLAVFTAASLAGGLAPTPGALIAARAVQGAGAAVLAPATLTALTTTFGEGHRRTRALAVWTAVSSVGGAAGNVLGGVLTELLTWRAVLLINVPVGAAALLVLPRVLRPAPGSGPRPRRLDLPGALTATAGVGALALGLGRAGEQGWGGPGTLAGLGCGLALLGAFALVERYAAEPLLPPALVRVRTVAVGNGIVLLAGACLQIPVWYFLTFHMQDVLGYSALRTGLGFLPHTVTGAAVAVWVTPALLRRAARRTLIVAGAAVCGAGFWWQSTVTADSGYLGGVLGPALVFSLGSAVFVTPVTATVTSRVPAAYAGAASGLLNTAKQLGGALGLAALSPLAGPHGGGHRTVFLAMTGVLAAIVLLATALPRDAPRDAPDVGRRGAPDDRRRGGVRVNAARRKWR